MIQDIIRNDFKPPTLDDIAINALAIMEEFRISEIPIVDSNQNFIGMIRASDIINMDGLQEKIHFIKSCIKPICIADDAHIFQIIQFANDNKLTLIPIVNSNTQYVGHIYPLDILKKLSINQNIHPNSIMVISSNYKDYSLCKISALIEENNGKIIVLWTEGLNRKINIHLLINCQNSRAMVQALERHDYTVIQTFSNNNTEDLDNRFESFIKYLNT